MNKYANSKSAIISVLMIVTASPAVAANDSYATAITTGEPYVNLLLRYERVDQRNSLKDADALTLRTRLGYKTGSYKGVSAVIEFEDSRNLFGVDDYSVPPTGFNTGVFSVIADPETTELDQAYLQYKSGGFTGLLGRQVITLDTHRFVGHVGWRQDRQTFDALTLRYQANEATSLQASHLVKRNRIFAEDRDVDVQDTLLNFSYKTSVGKLTAYAYLLEDDEVANSGLDTYGLRFNGSREMAGNKFLYAAEFATQDRDTNIDTDYLALEAGVELAGVIVRLGYELLGSDGGTNAFATPLATLHKFNGWGDQFLATPSAGLEDLFFGLSGSILGGKWNIVAHDYATDVVTIGGNDLGDEINASFTRKFGKHYVTGVKFSDYSAGAKEFGKVDTGKLWVWAGANF